MGLRQITYRAAYKGGKRWRRRNEKNKRKKNRWKDRVMWEVNVVKHNHNNGISRSTERHGVSPFSWLPTKDFPLAFLLLSSLLPLIVAITRRASYNSNPMHIIGSMARVDNAVMWCALNGIMRGKPCLGITVNRSNGSMGYLYSNQPLSIISLICIVKRVQKINVYILSSLLPSSRPFFSLPFRIIH